MINTNIKNSHQRIENLFKSIFADVPNTSISLNDESVIIEHKDKSNPDAASIEIIKIEEIYKVSYWDGYSLAEDESEKNLNKALKIFKRFSKKMAKNLIRFSKLLDYLFGSVPICLAIMPSMISSAPPPIEVSLPSRNALDIGVSHI